MQTCFAAKHVTPRAALAVLVCNNAMLKCVPCGKLGGPCCTIPPDSEENQNAENNPYYRCQAQPESDSEQHICSAQVDGVCKRLTDGVHPLCQCPLLRLVPNSFRMFSHGLQSIARQHAHALRSNLDAASLTPGILQLLHSCVRRSHPSVSWSPTLLSMSFGTCDVHAIVVRIAASYLTWQ